MTQVGNTALTQERAPTSLAPANPDLPSFMQGRELAGTEMLSQFIVPPRLKVMQKMTGKPLSDMFRVGDVVAMPMAELVSPIKLNASGKELEEGEPFHFVALCFYPEWVLWNPIETKGTLQAIRARSFSPSSDIAIRSRSPSTWSMPCPEMPRDSQGKELYCRYVEHLNFLIAILPPNKMAGVPVLMSFARGAHKDGTNLAALVQMRNAPIYGCQFEATVKTRRNDKGQEWSVIQVTNPSEDSGVTPFVMDQTLYSQYEAIHLDLKEKYKKGLIQADYEDEVETATSSKQEF